MICPPRRGREVHIMVCNLGWTLAAPTLFLLLKTTAAGKPEDSNDMYLLATTQVLSNQQKRHRIGKGFGHGTHLAWGA